MAYRALLINYRRSQIFVPACHACLVIPLRKKEAAEKHDTLLTPKTFDIRKTLFVFAEKSLYIYINMYAHVYKQMTWIFVFLKQKMTFKYTLLLSEEPVYLSIGTLKIWSCTSLTCHTRSRSTCCTWPYGSLCPAQRKYAGWEGGIRIRMHTDQTRQGFHQSIETTHV